MPKSSTRRPAGRTGEVQPPLAQQDDPDLDEPVDLDAVYQESLEELDPEWLDRYGEASWYAAITLFGLWTVDTEGRLEDIPEEYRWKGRSRLWPSDPSDDAASREGS